jgi:uncharacterized protein YdeI (YjbR/CyaY-like superfamily)
MKSKMSELPVTAFESAEKLRAWLSRHHATSSGLWVKIFKKGSGVPSVTFSELLDEGLCFGWSESMRRKGQDGYYLQRFTPRKKIGSQSTRNQVRVERLILEGRMTKAGLVALGKESV